MPDVNNPFTEDDFDRMETALQRAKDAEAAIKKAQSAGVELPGMLEENRAVADRLRRILTTYRPNR